ncbi:MAG: hypothetical protein K0S32_602 [Bacteroidetes bacterium]|jgi:hypothetical protein|nr:hypothetical protein [Bacteroidota bacterium]
MKTQIMFRCKIVLFILFTIKFSHLKSQTTLIWAHQLGSVSNQNLAYAMSVDNNNNYIITGNFNGTFDIDPSPTTVNLSTASGDGYVAKFNSSGNYVWAFNFSSSGSDYSDANDVKADALGNIYVTGDFTGTLDFDPGSGVSNLTASGTKDAFIAKYDANGNYVWAFNIGTSSQNSYGSKLALDNNGNVYVTGAFAGTVDFNPSASTNALTATNGDAFFAKYSSSGNYIWAFCFGNASGNCFNTNIDIFGNNIKMTGIFSGTLDFNTSASTNNLTATNNTRFLANYDLNANYVSAQTFEVGPVFIYALGNSMAHDNAGNLYIGGQFSGTIDFDAGPGTSTLTALGSNDVFLMKLSSTGSFIWVKNVTSSTGNNDLGQSVKTDPNGDVFIAGGFSGNADFDPSSSTFTLAGTGYSDIYVAKYTSAGNLALVFELDNPSPPSSSYSNVFGLYTDNSGDVVISGAFQGFNIDFDPGPGALPYSCGMASDIFIAKYATLPVGLSDSKTLSNQRMYPNPTQDEITLDLQDHHNHPFEISDMTGRILKKGTFRNETKLDVSDLPEGIYTIRIFSEGASVTSKLIKK